MYGKQRKGWRMSCDAGKATEGLENELWTELILQVFRHFTYEPPMMESGAFPYEWDIFEASTGMCYSN